MISSLRKLVLLHVLVLSVDAFLQGLQETCEDNPNFRILVNVTTGRTESCSWIDLNVNDINYRRREQCEKAVKQNVRDACPRACGVCCGDNPEFTFLYNHPERGYFGADCNYVRMNKEELCPSVEKACPAACGLCPTSDPSSVPSANPVPTANAVPASMEPSAQSGSAPTPQVGGAGGGGESPTDDGPTSTTEFYLHFAAEVYTKDRTIKSLPTGDILNGLNEFFDRKREGYQNHKIFVTLANNGIVSIDFTFLVVDDAFEEYIMQCGEKPETYKKSVCSTAVGTTKITYYDDNGNTRREKRLLSNDETIESKVDTILMLHAGAVSGIIDNVDGIALVNTATDLESLINTTPSIESVNEVKKNKVARIAIPVVLVTILVGLILCAYVAHQRRKNAIIVELEEEDIEDHRLLSKRGRRAEKKSRDMLFPVVQSDDEDDNNFLSNGIDLLCGADTNEKNKN